MTADTIGGVWQYAVDLARGLGEYGVDVTLATLGYGDFLPRSELARGVATFEVIVGQLYLAVMVARLIGAFGPAKPTA